MKAFLKKTLLGTNIPQEYLCLALNEIKDPLRIIFRSGKFELDVTESHLFLGYKPVIIGVIFENDIKADELENSEIFFIDPRSEKTIAALKLMLVSFHRSNNIAIYKCIHGMHRFIDPLQNLLTLLHQKIEKKKMGNVNLPGNLYEQVKIAYSVPRKICLITLGDDGLYNMFPTDLHGKIDDENYIISLRNDGKANEQVNNFKKITLSKMDLTRYKFVYSLGKNHMQEAKAVEAFEVRENTSELLELPLPEGGIDYMELELKSSIVTGIHNLNYFKIINSKVISQNAPVLSHVHRAYLLWLLKRGNKISYLLR